MKKFGILIFIFAVIFGVVFSNLFSFGKASGKVFSFSLGSSVKGSGVNKSEVREVKEFTGVDVGGVFTVDITAGKEFGIEVETDDNLLQYVRTEVRGGILKIDTTERIKPESGIRVRVTAPNIERLNVSGVAKVFVNDLKNESIDIDTSGASKITVAGTTTDLTIDVSGASKIDANGLKAENANVDASGASHVDVFVTGRLTSEASGASKVEYQGNPTSVEKNASGAGRIRSK
jgi:hypothetical protein